MHFSNRAHNYTREEIDVVVMAMRDADPLTQGRYQGAFEEKFREYTGASFAFAVCNATSALEMTAQLCRIKQGDEVVVPSHTFTSSAYPFAKRGATLVWADIDLKTRVITAQTIAAKVTPRTKAIVVPHLYGFVADMPSIMEFARPRALVVIEDAAQSLGSEVAGRMSGTFGDFGVFSFHSAKNVTTLGEGGMLVVQSEKVANIVPMLRHNGHCDFPFPREDNWKPAMGSVDFPELDGEMLWPNNYCLGEVESALGAKLLERIDRINVEKRRRALWFIDALRDFPELEFHRVGDTRHNYHLLVARVTNGCRDDFIRAMARSKGVQCVVQYCPLNRYPLYERIGLGHADCPNADQFFDNMVSFPFNHWLSDQQLEYLLESTRAILRQLRQ